jgi:hypothetical protein
MWSGALDLVLRSPLAGYGPDGFRVALARVAAQSMIAREGASNVGFATVPVDPHNVVLAVAVSGGLVCLAALGWLGAECVRTWIVERRTTGRFSSAAVGTVAFVLAGLTAPMTMQDLPLAAVVIGASVPLGSAIAHAGVVRGRRRTSAVLGTAAAAALVALSVSGTYLWVGPIDSADTDAARSLWAVRLLPGDPLLRLVASRRLMAVAVAGDPDAGAASVLQAASATAIAPRDPFYAIEHGSALASIGRQVEALAEFERALTLFPASPDAAQGAALAALALGRTPEARAYARLALEVAPLRAEAHEIAALVYDAAGDPAEAARERAEAARLGGP